MRFHLSNIHQNMIIFYLHAVIKQAFDENHMQLWGSNFTTNQTHTNIIVPLSTSCRLKCNMNEIKNWRW